MKVAIIRYNAGNTQSVIYALNRVGVDPIVTLDKEEIRSADKVVFPGVGEAGSAMKFLREQQLDILIPSLTQPTLGICVGLQLMCAHSEEGDTKGMGIFPIQVKKFPPGDKVPQIGWNGICNLSTKLFEGVKENDKVYFVHSYYAELSEYGIAETNYQLRYHSALHKDNFYAVQFHTEKSGEVGHKILENFIKL